MNRVFKVCWVFKANQRVQIKHQLCFLWWRVRNIYSNFDKSMLKFWQFHVTTVTIHGRTLSHISQVSQLALTDSATDKARQWSDFEKLGIMLVQNIWQISRLILRFQTPFYSISKILSIHNRFSWSKRSLDGNFKERESWKVQKVHFPLVSMLQHT